MAWRSGGSRPELTQRGRRGPLGPDQRVVRRAGAAPGSSKRTSCTSSATRRAATTTEPGRGREPAGRARRAAWTCRSRSAPETSRCSPASTSSRSTRSRPATSRSRTCTSRPARRRPGQVGPQRAAAAAACAPARARRSRAAARRPSCAGRRVRSTLRALEAVDVLVVVARAAGCGRSTRCRCGSRRGAGRAPPAARRRSPPSAGARRPPGAPRTPSSRRRTGARPARRCPARDGSRSNRSVHTSSSSTRSWLASTHDAGQVAQERRQQLDRVVVEVVGRLVEQQAGGPRGHQRGQGEPGALAARQGADRRRRGRASPSPSRSAASSARRSASQASWATARSSAAAYAVCAGSRSRRSGQPRAARRRRPSGAAARGHRPARRRSSGRRGTAAPGRASPGRAGRSTVPVTRARAGSVPAIARSRVDLPEPFSPTRPIRRPG